MHEFSVTNSILEILNGIISEKKINKIDKINFLLSPLGGIEKESAQFYFEFLTKDNPVYKKCELAFREDVLKARCVDCKNISEVDLNKTMKCSFCNSHSLKIIPADDIKIVSIDI
jgi:hydrogenase nickel insertion protein HypA